MWQLSTAKSEPLASALQVTSPKSVENTISLEEITDAKPEYKGMKAIKAPRIRPISTLIGQLPPQESGMVISFGREHRFYPYDWLKHNNIVNDTVGGVSVLVSFCNSCNSGIVFSRKLNNKTLVFEISGKTYHSDWLVEDATYKSLWWQISGKAVTGDMVGQQLEQLFSAVMTYAEFSRAYPNGYVVI